MRKILSGSLLAIAVLVASQGAVNAESLASKGETRQSVTANAGNGFYYPANRWAYQHMEQLYPTASIDSKVVVTPLAKQLQNLDDLLVADAKGNKVKLADFLAATYTDAFVVVKDGKIVYEKYLNGQNERSRHQMMSVTKSISSTAIEPLIEQGKIDPTAKVTKYVPELANSAWGDATVQEVRDMLVSLDFTEDYADPLSGFNNYLRAMKMAAPTTNNPALANKGMHQFLQAIKKGKGPHGQVFFYATPNTDVMCWIAERASGKSADALITDNLWSKLGATRDAYILLDQQGQAFCGAGYNATAVDLAKLGVVMANDGQLNGQQLVSKSFIDTLKKGGSKEAFDKSHYGHLDFLKGWTYKDQWWIRNNAHRAFSAIGIYGQFLYVDPTAKVVIVRQTSRKVAQNEDDGAIFASFDTIINKLNE